MYKSSSLNLHSCPWEQLEQSVIVSCISSVHKFMLVSYKLLVNSRDAIKLSINRNVILYYQVRSAIQSRVVLNLCSSTLCRAYHQVRDMLILLKIKYKLKIYDKYSSTKLLYLLKIVRSVLKFIWFCVSMLFPISKTEKVQNPYIPKSLIELSSCLIGNIPIFNHSFHVKNINIKG